MQGIPCKISESIPVTFLFTKIWKAHSTIEEPKEAIYNVFMPLYSRVPESTLTMERLRIANLARLVTLTVAACTSSDSRVLEMFEQPTPFAVRLFGHFNSNSMFTQGLTSTRPMYRRSDRLFQLENILRLCYIGSR